MLPALLGTDVEPEHGSASIAPGDEGLQRLRVADERLRYQMWVLRQMPSRDDLYKQRLATRRLRQTPLISVVTPVYNTPPDMLRRMLSSVRNQTYPHWQHCLVDDGSSEAWIARMLERAAGADERVIFRRRQRNGGIVVASNDAVDLATGELVAFLDHDDELDPQALYAVARKFNDCPDVDVMYSDLDLIGVDGIRTAPYFWPDWSPELLLCFPFIVHLRVYRRELLRAVGAFREGLDGAQDYDLALRITERTDRIAHIPQILYHWRVAPHSAANNPDAKPYAFEAGKRAIGDYLTRNRIEAHRDNGPFLGSHRVQFDRAIQPSVSIVSSLVDAAGATPSRSLSSLAESLTRIASGTDYPHVEIVVVTPPSLMDCARLTLAEVSRMPVRVVDAENTPDDAHALNVGAAHAGGEQLLFLGEDLEGLAGDWLSALVDFSRQNAIGAVGPKVYAHDGTIEHAGIVLPRGVPRHVLRGAPGSSNGYQWNLRVRMNYSAVSGACLMTRRAVFDEVGGFRSAAVVGYSDVDYCLRVREHGYRIVFTPDAELRYLGPLAASEATDGTRLTAFRRQWSSRLGRDPYYNPSFDQDDAQFVVGLD